mmetsp:Transcript_1738/g.2665  ORF Transcript_1738/g.2665 Transcript_1738/m.2665 type:complete len:630 (+) Transcript_1738:72-1961(+)
MALSAMTPAIVGLGASPGLRGSQTTSARSGRPQLSLADVDSKAWSLTSALSLASVAASGMGLVTQRRRWRAGAGRRHTRPMHQVMFAGNRLAALKDSPPTAEEVKELFDSAKSMVLFSGGISKERVLYPAALRLEDVASVLEEGAVTQEELGVLWGYISEQDKGLDLAGFSAFYYDVLKLYDEHLWQGAIAPPSELFDDEDNEDFSKYPDEMLLEDAPTRVEVRGLKTSAPKRGVVLTDGSLTGKVPIIERSLLVDAEEVGGKEIEEAGGLPDGAASGSRQNVEITRLFREACDERNLLSFEALLEISEIDQLIDDEDLSQTELRDMWAELAKKADCIDVLAFRDLLKKIDELFEYVEEEEEGGELVLSEEAEEEEEEEPDLPEKPKLRSVDKVRTAFLRSIEGLEATEPKPCGLSGLEETDEEVVRLAEELEASWRQQVGDLGEYDTSQFVGDWELIYSTSMKFRRWGNVLNNGRELGDAKFEALVQSFALATDKKLLNEYDMDEVFKDDGKELSMRGMGSWKVSIQQNVVTGLEDLVLRVSLNGIEYDTIDGEVEQASEKVTMSQMCRTFCYSFLSYMDDEYRVMRTGLMGKSLFLFQRIKPEIKGLLEEPEDRQEAFDPVGRIGRT